jgi:hypothetical protein
MVSSASRRAAVAVVAFSLAGEGSAFSMGSSPVLPARAAPRAASHWPTSARPTVAATARRPPSFVRRQSRGGGGGGQEMIMGPGERATALGGELPRAVANGVAMREGWATLLGIAVHLRRFLANVLLVLSLGSGLRV